MDKRSGHRKASRLDNAVDEETNESGSAHSVRRGSTWLYLEDQFLVVNHKEPISVWHRAIILLFGWYLYLFVFHRVTIILCNRLSIRRSPGFIPSEPPVSLAAVNHGEHGPQADRIALGCLRRRRFLYVQFLPLLTMLIMYAGPRLRRHRFCVQAISRPCLRSFTTVYAGPQLSSPSISVCAISPPLLTISHHGVRRPSVFLGRLRRHLFLYV
jgi:hypothetical protein